MIKLLSLILLFNIQLICFAADKKGKKTQEVSFDGVDIDGVVRTPDGAYLQQKRGVKFMPLYKVQKNFDQEIKGSVDYLR